MNVWKQILNNKRFRRYLLTRSNESSNLSKLLENGIPFGKISVITGQSARSVIDIYKDYLEYSKIENRDERIIPSSFKEFFNDIVNNLGFNPSAFSNSDIEWFYQKIILNKENRNRGSNILKYFTKEDYISYCRDKKINKIINK